MEAITIQKTIVLVDELAMVREGLAGLVAWREKRSPAAHDVFVGPALAWRGVEPD